MKSSERINYIKKWILDYCKSMPKEPNTLVVGISGGIDSSVTSTICALTGKKTIVFKPVIAHKVLETEESIPPEIPITNDFALLGILST